MKVGFHIEIQEIQDKKEVKFEMMSKKMRLWNERNLRSKGVETHRRESSSVLNIRENSNRRGSSETIGFGNLELFKV